MSDVFLFFLISFVLVIEVISEPGVSLIEEVAVKQEEKRIEMLVVDNETMKQMPREVADDWSVLLVPVRAPTFVPPRTAGFASTSSSFLYLFFFSLLCSSPSQRSITLCP